MERFLWTKTRVPATAALFQAVPQCTNAGRGENYKGSENIITNGSLEKQSNSVMVISPINKRYEDNNSCSTLFWRL